MDDIAEQHDIANEISNAISNPVGFGEDIDEDELNKELEELEEEELEKVMNIMAIKDCLRTIIIFLGTYRCTWTYQITRPSQIG